MDTIEKIMQEPMTLEELERDIATLKTLIPTSDGALYIERVQKLTELQKQRAAILCAKPEDVIAIGFSSTSFEDEKIDSDNNDYRDRFNRFTYDTHCIE